MELRCLVSAPDSGAAFDLRAEVREQLIAFLQAEHPYALPRERQVFYPPGQEPSADEEKSLRATPSESRPQ